MITGVPVGLGEPVFDKLHAQLGNAMLGINAVKGFEYGSGFEGIKMRGSEHNDQFEKKDGRVVTSSNHSGGIQGGISNGQDIYFNVAFKPVATIMKDQDSLNQQGEPTVVKGKGRHDPCVVPRAVPIVDAMAALVLADCVLLNMSAKLIDMKKLALHWKILIGMAVGVVLGIAAILVGFNEFVLDWIKPFGTIFINLLKLIAVPLILVSLIDGISNLTDLSKLSRIGGKTIGFYIFSTVLAISIGLILVNLVEPGKFLPDEKREELRLKYASEANLKVETATTVEDEGPLQILVDVVPDNIFGAFGNNQNMLQVIFFAFMFGIAMVMTPQAKALTGKKVL